MCRLRLLSEASRAGVQVDLLAEATKFTWADAPQFVSPCGSAFFQSALDAWFAASGMGARHMQSYGSYTPKPPSGEHDSQAWLLAQLNNQGKKPVLAIATSSAAPLVWPPKLTRYANGSVQGNAAAASADCCRCNTNITAHPIKPTKTPRAPP